MRKIKNSFWYNRTGPEPIALSQSSTFGLRVGLLTLAFNTTCSNLTLQLVFGAVWLVAYTTILSTHLPPSTNQSIVLLYGPCHQIPRPVCRAIFFLSYEPTHKHVLEHALLIACPTAHCDGRLRSKCMQHCFHVFAILVFSVQRFSGATQYQSPSF